jgi:hypothetical protein
MGACLHARHCAPSRGAANKPNPLPPLSAHIHNNTHKHTHTLHARQTVHVHLGGGAPWDVPRKVCLVHRVGAVDGAGNTGAPCRVRGFVYAAEQQAGQTGEVAKPADGSARTHMRMHAQVAHCVQRSACAAVACMQARSHFHNTL